MTEQPGYDALAGLYDETFPEAFGSATERAAVDLFVERIRALGTTGPVIDVGCGTGHQVQHLASKGIDVVGVDPSGPMLERARRRFPDLTFVQDDALLDAVDIDQVAGILARFSLIHVPPDEIADVLASWAERLVPGGVVLVAFQALGAGDAGDVEEFDHAVARAWRWRPDAMADALSGAGIRERWRLVEQPSEGFHRFPECHVLGVRSG